VTERACATPASTKINVSPYHTAEEAAEYLRTTVQGVYSLKKRGLLHPLPGRTGRLLFTRESLDRYLEVRRRGR
jgi:hypothetical protein